MVIRVEVCRALLMLGAALVNSGCLGSARVVRSDGSEYIGRIVDGTPQTLRLRLHDREVDVPRQEIAELHHPGRPQVILGSILLGIGMIVPLSVLAESGAVDDEERFGMLMTGALSLTGGVALLSYGIVVRRRSERRAGEVSLRLKPSMRAMGRSIRCGMEVAF